MRKTTRYLGLDVHAETIAVAVAEAGREGQALRGVAKLSAVTVAVEVGSFSRFERPRSIHGYQIDQPSTKPPDRCPVRFT